jgi:hypothetical protein
MLTLQIASDLHFEQETDSGFRFMEAMDPTGVDVLALVGGITAASSPTLVQDIFSRLAAKYPRILYVPGSTELWGTTPADAIFLLRIALANNKQVSVMDGRVLAINGHRFIGGPMWFPQWTPYADQWAAANPDLRNIVDFRGWVVSENARFQLLLDRTLQAGDVVLTSYLPSNQSARAISTEAVPFSVTPMDSLIAQRQPAYWVHGRAGCNLDYRIADTRIVCNPRRNNAGYKQKLLLPLY